MNTAVINIKTDPEVKAKAQIVAKELGMNLSTILNAYLTQLVRTKTINFSVDDEEPTEYLLASLRESEEDIKQGRVSPSFDNATDALAWLDDPKRKYQNES